MPFSISGPMLPSTLRAGDTWEIEIPEDSDYPNSEYIPHLRFAGNDAFTLDGAINNLTVAVTAANSAPYQPGIYTITLYWTKNTEVHTTLETQIEILRNLITTAAGFDSRSHVRKVRDALQATIEGRATKAQTALSIGGRSLEMLSPAELRVEWQHYNRLVEQEERAEKIKRGDVPSNKILTRFDPVT